ncbi:MAG TPA: S49 family peptidase, partial [Flavobacteriales bacterium]|nr:S49 family peptidase [Flavobacteriales bacterium]
MRQFFKFMLASMVGTLLIGVVLIFLFIGSLAALAGSYSFKGKPTFVKDGSVLRFTLDQDVVDRGEQNDFDLDFGPFRGRSKVGLNDLLADLEKAKTDDRVKGVFLDLGYVDARMATLKELRDKVVEFRAESGKPVVAFADMYTQGTYYLASAADQVYLVPEGDLDFRGLRSEMMFFKGLFNKLGVEMQFIRGSNNKFKSFGEVFTEDHMSDANRQQVTVLLNGLWDEYLNGISGQRKLDKAKLNGIAEGLQVRKADDAVQLGMIDGVKYRDEVLALLKERMGLPADKDINFVSENKYAKAHVPAAKKK